MGIPDNTHKASCDAVVALGDWISVHTNAAGTNGANEASGGGYARKQATYPTGSMSGGYWTRTAPGVTFDVAAGTYKEAGNWSASTSGTFLASAAFTGGDVEVSGSGATITVTSTIRA